MAFIPPHRREEDEISGDAGWLIQEVKPDCAPLRIVEQTIGEAHSEAVFEGGKPGDLYLVTSQVDTVEGQVLKHSFVLAVTA